MEQLNRYCFGFDFVAFAFSKGFIRPLFVFLAIDMANMLRIIGFIVNDDIIDKNMLI